MGALNGRDDTLMPGQQEQCLDGILVPDSGIADAAEVVEQRVLRACRRIIQAAGVGIYRSRIAVLIGQHDAVEAVHDAFFSVCDGCRVVPQLRAAAQGLHTHQLHRVRQERREHADGVGTAADTGRDLVRQMSGLLKELCPRFFADNVLEIADHQREGMGAGRRTDAVDGIPVLVRICREGSIDRFLQGLKTEAHRDHVGAEKLHACHVRGLLGDIHFTHVDIALQSEICRRRGQRHAVLSGAGLRDQLLLSHVFRQQSLAHAVVQFMGTGKVEVLALQIDLRHAQFAGKPLTVIDRGRASLIFPADPAQLGDELRGVGDRLIGFGDLFESRDQFVRDKAAAVRPVPAVFIRSFLQISSVIHSFPCMRSP